MSKEHKHETNVRRRGGISRWDVLLIVSLVMFAIAAALGVAFVSYKMGYGAGQAALEVLRLKNITCEFAVPSINLEN